MRTIIPFPALKSLDAQAQRGDEREPSSSAAGAASISGELPPDLPEGETRSPELDGLSPRARAVHSSIVSLIQTVRGRFG